MSNGPSGIGFVECELLRSASDDGAHSGEATPHSHAQRREVVVNGTRVRTVDVHAHCAVPAALAVLGRDCEKAELLMTDNSVRIAAMDEQGIDVSALSINPYWYHAERDEAAELIKVQNDALAEICATTPDRFVAFATIALQHPELAIEQIAYGVKNLGMRGVSVGCGVEGQELADEKFHPVWAKCEELDLLVFMHPSGTKELEPSGRLAGSGVLTNTIGNPLETTIALSHLIFEGTLDRYPGLKICAVHGGGYLPSYANRSDAVCRTFPDRVGPLPKKPPTSYLKDGQLFFDTIVFTPEALRHLIAETGPGQIMVGTDYPYGWTSTEIDLVLNTPDLSDDDRIAILGGTAARLLGIEG
ncbi:MAG: amidohydrolase [Rhodospirillaceae bacterium]|jgi:aminocarboxymuconate-semialdehyde decarboxylase|nr:amidohydrolase [Rhodospirillaceae bacterium]